MPQTSSTDTGATPCFDGNHPLMSSLLIARGQKWAFLNPNMINFSTPTILRFDHLLRFLHSSSNDHFPKHPPLPPPSLPLYYRPPPLPLIPQRFSSRDTQASHASLSFVQCLPPILPPMATSYYHLKKCSTFMLSYFVQCVPLYSQ